MENREIDCLLARIEGLAKETQRLSDSVQFHEKRANGLERIADEVGHVRANLGRSEKDLKEARAKVFEWEKYGEALRDLVPIAKRTKWPKHPEAFDDIPF